MVILQDYLVSSIITSLLSGCTCYICKFLKTLMI